MKSIKKSANIPKRIVVTAICVIVLIAAYFGIASAYSMWPFGIGQEPTTSSEVDPNSDKNEERKNDSETINDSAKNQDDTDSPQEQSERVTITAANQNGEFVQIRTLITSITSNGTCDLTLSNGSTAVTRVSGVQALSSSSTCQGFDIPTSELKTGTWDIKLTVTHDSSVLSTTGKVIIK